MSPQVGYGPLKRIDGPLPIPPVYGLLQAAAAPASGVQIITEADDEWMNGVEVYPYPPGPAHAWDPAPTGTSRGVKDPGVTLPHPQFGAFAVYVTIQCTSYKVPDQAAFKARAGLALAAVESAGVAFEFMTGQQLGLNPHLANGQGTFPNGNTATSAENAVAFLENEIAASGKLGLLHMSPGMAAALAAGHLIRDIPGQVLRTVNGTVVIPDAGYAPRSTPFGHPAAATVVQEWIYATGPIEVRRSEIFTTPETIAEALDRAQNSIVYRAERFYLVDWDTTLQAAVLADRCQSTC